MFTRQLLLPVPNWQYSPLRFLMGRRQIAVALYTTADAENLLSLTIQTSEMLPASDPVKLRGLWQV